MKNRKRWPRHVAIALCIAFLALLAGYLAGHLTSLTNYEARHSSPTSIWIGQPLPDN